MAPSRIRLFLVALVISISSFSFLPTSIAVDVLSKSKLEKCVKVSGSDSLHCDMKIVVNIAVPSGSSGGEASIVAELVEVEENSTQQMQTIRDPPLITVHKSPAYALYEITYMRDVAYKPQEFYWKTRKCEPDAGRDVVNVCERLRDQNGHVNKDTQPICCACGPHRRIPSSCGNFFEKIRHGKANTAHCLRFPGDWFHVFAIGRRSLGFSVRIEVKRGSKISEVIVGPENRTVLSDDKFLKVNLIGDFVGYTSLPSFEDFYLVIPRQGTFGPLQDLGKNFSRWMLLERVRFTLNGLECNKIGVSYKAYNGQPNFCAAPFWSCLHNQLWNFWEADQSRIRRNQSPQYVVEGRFQRINEHPNAGTHSFSIGITEALNTNLLMELNADDIEYVYQKSPGQIIDITIPTFEALTQFGMATITTKNIGKLEASYSLTFQCSSGVSQMEEQFFIMVPEEIASRSFKLYPTADQAATYECTAVLKASDFSEVDRADCQFTTTSTVLDNGSQIISPHMPTSGGINGFLESIENLWNSMWNGLSNFFTGKSCRSRCSGLFDFSCHIRYICLTWVLFFGLLLAIIPTAMVLLWLLHQKGFFDPLHDWWEDWFGSEIKASDIHPRHRPVSSHTHAHKGTDHHVHKEERHGRDKVEIQMGHHTSHGHPKRWYSSIDVDDNIHHTRGRTSARERKGKHKHGQSDKSRWEHRRRSSLGELPLVIRDHEEKNHGHHKHKHPKI